MAEEVKQEVTEQAPAAPAAEQANASAEQAPAAEQANESAEQANAPAPDLNISDLNTVKSIIDIATQRGAFKANELEAVGKAYNKLSAFLDHVVKQNANKGEEK